MVDEKRKDMEINKDMRESFNLIFDRQKKFVVGQKVDFHFTTSCASLSKLKLNVLGPSKCKIKHYKLRDGLFGVSFVPLTAGNYMVIVKWDGSEVTGSPIICNVGEEETVFQTRPVVRRSSISSSK